MKNTLTVNIKRNIKKKNIAVTYGHTELTHWFFIDGINEKYIEQLKDHLREEYFGNGDIRLYSRGKDGIQLSYETTDSYEYTEEFTYILTRTVEDSVDKFKTAIKYLN